MMPQWFVNVGIDMNKLLVIVIIGVIILSFFKKNEEYKPISIFNNDLKTENLGIEGRSTAIGSIKIDNKIYNWAYNEVEVVITKYETVNDIGIISLNAGMQKARLQYFSDLPNNLSSDLIEGKKIKARLQLIQLQQAGFHKPEHYYIGLIFKESITPIDNILMGNMIIWTLIIILGILSPAFFQLYFRFNIDVPYRVLLFILGLFATIAYFSLLFTIYQVIRFCIASGIKSIMTPEFIIYRGLLVFAAIVCLQAISFFKKGL
jgi:hypothetical protein